VGKAENTTAPDPLHGNIPVVGIGRVPYAENVTAGTPAAVLAVMNWAVIERPREPVLPVPGDGRCWGGHADGLPACRVAHLAYTNRART